MHSSKWNAALVIAFCLLILVTVLTGCAPEPISGIVEAKGYHRVYVGVVDQQSVFETRPFVRFENHPGPFTVSEQKFAKAEIGRPLSLP